MSLNIFSYVQRPPSYCCVHCLSWLLLIFLLHFWHFPLILRILCVLGILPLLCDLLQIFSPSLSIVFWFGGFVWLYVLDIVIPLKNVHALISRTCKHFTLCGKGYFVGMIKLASLVGGRLSWIIQVGPVSSRGSYRLRISLACTERDIWTWNKIRELQHYWFWRWGKGSWSQAHRQHLRS